MKTKQYTEKKSHVNKYEGELDQTAFIYDNKYMCKGGGNERK